MSSKLNFEYEFIPYPKDPDGTHQGTGNVSYGPLLARLESVRGGPSKPLEFSPQQSDICVLCLTIKTELAPNWFGVAYARDIVDLGSANIFFHPYPGTPTAQMYDKNYQARNGNWSHLFRYTQNLGFQIATAGANQIQVVPLFSNASYYSGGIFTRHWKEILTVIVHGVSIAGKRGQTRLTL